MSPMERAILADCLTLLQGTKLMSIELSRDAPMAMQDYNVTYNHAVTHYLLTWYSS